MTRPCRWERKSQFYLKPDGRENDGRKARDSPDRRLCGWVIAVEVRRVFACGLDVNVGDTCNSATYRSARCHGTCETGLLLKGVCKQVGYLFMGSRQPVPCTNNCGQVHGAKRAECGAGSCSKHIREGVKRGAGWIVVDSQWAVFSFTLPLWRCQSPRGDFFFFFCS